MKIPNTLRAFASALVIAGSLTISPAAHAEETDLSQVLSRHAELLGELAKAVAAAGQEAVMGAKTDDGATAKPAGLQTSSLQTGSLTTGSLQGSNSLATGGSGSLAAGLTPLEQWRVFFPEKK